MNVRFLFIILVVTTFSLTNCNYFTKYLICIPSTYKGWIYVIKSSDNLNGTIYCADSNGLVFVPQEIYHQNNVFQIVVDGKIQNESFKSWYSEYYTESNRKITYTKFYYPLTFYPKEERFFHFEGNEVTEFQYLYYSKTIDETRLAK